MCHNRITDLERPPSETSEQLLSRLGWKNIISVFWYDPLEGGTWDEASAARIARRREDKEFQSEETE